MIEGIPARHSVPKRMIRVARSFPGIFGQINGRPQSQGGGEKEGNHNKVQGADQGSQDAAGSAHIHGIGG